MIHKTEIEGYQGDLQQLAKELGDLRYDALATFLEHLSSKITEDGEKDQARNRVQLAKQLQSCAEQLSSAASSIDKAWKISEPYM